MLGIAVALVIATSLHALASPAPITPPVYEGNTTLTSGTSEFDVGISGARAEPAIPVTAAQIASGILPSQPHAAIAPRVPLENCLGDWRVGGSCFEPKGRPQISQPQSPGVPAITITDVASFKPAGALVSAKPNNLGIAGLPVNFVAPASAQELTGTIFDLPVSVRFTPVAFDFHTGDGTVVTSVTGGSTWEQLGLPQFSPTATSHTYRERGTYDAHVEVHYSAEVDLGTGWIPLTGTVTSVGATQQIRIFEAHTALVAHTCLETPTAPGC